MKRVLYFACGIAAILGGSATSAVGVAAIFHAITAEKIV